MKFINKILIVVGTRPNFIKVTQFKKHALKHPRLTIKIVHTGQHFDSKMADVFFEQFKLVPDYFLNISLADAGAQIAEIKIKLEGLIKNEFTPDLVMVVGDVNSTLAAALTADKLKIPIAHLESGLRSFDKTMPEENNRIITDGLSKLFFVTEESGLKHLSDEKQNPDSVYFVGNTMIDTMVAFENEIESSNILLDLKIKGEKFILMTMHRPATVDNIIELGKLISLIESLSDKYKIVFPIHPRTIKNAKEFGYYDKIVGNKNLIVTEPLDYFSFQKLIKECVLIITDSGGIQEESTFRKKPCLTLRPNTERPITIDIGTNTLLPFDIEKVKNMVLEIENGSYKKGSIPPLWDGKSTERILEILSKL